MEFQNFRIMNFLSDYLSGLTDGFKGGAINPQVLADINALNFGKVINNYYNTTNPKDDILTLQLKDGTDFFENQVDIVKEMVKAVDTSILSATPPPNFPTRVNPVLVEDLGVVDRTKSAKEIYYPILLIAKTIRTGIAIPKDDTPKPDVDTSATNTSLMDKIISGDVPSITKDDLNKFTDDFDKIITHLKSSPNGILKRNQLGMILKFMKDDPIINLKRNQLGVRIFLLKL